MTFPLLALGLGALGGGLIGSMFGGGSKKSKLPTVGGGGNFLTGYGAQAQQLPRFTPEQQSALNQLLSQGLGQVKVGQGDENPIEQRARQQFQSQTIPSLAERFTSMGGSGTRGSSDFAGILGGAGADLESQLAMLRYQSALQQLGLGLQPSFENIYIPQQGGLLQGAAPGLGQGLGQFAGGALKSLFL
jgi:hypothetical protein